MPKKTTHINKNRFRPPDGVSIEEISNLYTTSKDIALQGYEGPIQNIKSKKEILEKPAFECRPVKNHGGKAWVSLKS